MRFEDEKGEEEIFLHAERDLNHIVKRNESTEVGNDRSEQVMRDENIHIGNNRTETVVQDEALTVNRDQLRHIGRNRITRIEKDEILNINNSYRLEVHGDTHIHVGKDLTIEVAQNGSWHAGELLEQICDQFELEGYEQVALQGPGGTIVITREGIELIGNVYVEGELRKEGGAAEGVNSFETTINNTLTPTTYYSSRLDAYDIYGRCNEKKVPYTILDGRGDTITDGILDDIARTPRIYRETEESLQVLVGHAEVRIGFK
ncbi:bacteriophage T4 gp5 trimerisation domain-containing protein [Actinobacillus equuli]|uniref:bacteriophage T4 gp5 trimerisation domain-containing protein n=1 Tax=Actinobacillus equuli TaxID=718 RepID=UPI003C6EE491